MEALREVKDPEIPTVSLVDLGLITQILYPSSGGLLVKMVPTFTGCPALRHMKDQVRERLERLGVQKVGVEIDNEIAWNTNMITEQGLKDIEKIGLSAPGRYCGALDLAQLPTAKCPTCHSDKTLLVSPFGPTLCRAVYYCNDCEGTFEQFKPI
ncbi:MAG: phenylacetate-CoA oxygenase subunit PaaJ [Bacteroidetes bacterium]|nr:phenylacetate-CoA oxygenase subunit PaaJ [Bacteroidota bacterium]